MTRESEETEVELCFGCFGVDGVVVVDDNGDEDDDNDDEDVDQNYKELGRIWTVFIGDFLVYSS